MSEYRICTRCIMDNKTSPKITFDEKGVCCYCKKFDSDNSLFGYKGDKSDEELKSLVEEIKNSGKGKEYDCILGISGGVDSAYLAYIATRLGLRILAVHVDAGWNSEVAVDNIEKMCKKLNIDLHTIVIDWPSMKEIQRAYMFSGLVNLDVPQDHAFLAAVFHYAMDNKISYMLNGSNYATEGILPENFGHAAVDYRHLKSVYKKCGRGKKALKKYPHFSLVDYAWCQKNIKRVNLLNYVPYSKKLAIEVLHREFDWNYYGGKHYESRFTKFYQGSFLVDKYGFDKRRAHLSSLVVGGEMTRDEALEAMADYSEYPKEQQIEDRDYIIKKLDISLQEWDEIMKAPAVDDKAYKGNVDKIKKLSSIKRRLFTLKRRNDYREKSSKNSRLSIYK